MVDHIDIFPSTNNPSKLLLRIPENDFAGYTVMLRGGVKHLNDKQKSLLMDVALLSNDYERLKNYFNDDRKI